jgi:DNA-binding transcriptional LysR family regulator
MKLHFLRYFVVLAEELHFGRAARRLSITQPPLSTAIRSLEDELGVQLFVRDSKHVALTPAGLAFLGEARHILDRVQRASSVAALAARGVSGRLEVGVTGSLVYREVPRIVHAYNRAVPEVDVVLREMSTADQLDELLRGRLDLGFVNAGTVPAALQAWPLAEDEFVLCLPERHALAARRQVALRDLADEQFVMFSRDVAPANHDHVIAIFSRAGIHPRTVHAARQWLTVIAMVAHGLGVSIVPRSLARSRLHGVRFVRFAGDPVGSPASLVWNPERLSTAARSLVETARRLVPAAGPAALTAPSLPARTAA